MAVTDLKPHKTTYELLKYLVGFLAGVLFIAIFGLLYSETFAVMTLEKWGVFFRKIALLLPFIAGIVLVWFNTIIGTVAGTLVLLVGLVLSISFVFPAQVNDLLYYPMSVVPNVDSYPIAILGIVMVTLGLLKLKNKS